MAGLMSGFGAQSPGVMAPQRPPASPAMFPAALPPQAPGTPPAPASLGPVPVMQRPINGMTTSPIGPEQMRATLDQMQALQSRNAETAAQIPAGGPAPVRAPVTMTAPEPVRTPVVMPRTMTPAEPVRAPVTMPTSLPGPVRQPVVMPPMPPAATTSPMSQSLNSPLDDHRNAIAANLAANGHPNDRPNVQRIINAAQSGNLNRLAGALQQRRLGMRRG